VNVYSAWYKSALNGGNTRIVHIVTGTFHNAYGIAIANKKYNEELTLLQVEAEDAVIDTVVVCGGAGQI